MRINRKLIKQNKRIRMKNPNGPVPRSLVKPKPISVPNDPQSTISDFVKVRDFEHNKTVYPNVVSCIIRDRIGNNLFEIATTVGLALRNKCIPIFENWAYSEFFDWDLTFDSELEKSIPWNVHVERCFHYYPIQCEHNLKISGHFQSYKHFPEDVILYKFKPKQAITDYIMNKYKNLMKTRTTSIHVRRGDYVNNWNYHQVGIDYYKRAVESLSKETDNFVVFSDDINWCKSAMNFPNTRFIQGEEDYVDLFMMSMCNNNIITNSTFSWWGAFLNKNDGKKIIAPNKWFGAGLRHYDSKDIIPPVWTQISC